ncbi:MAG: hypothetical protein KC478_17415, partial [Bacteriovoracaceae bacterium]|nr:hypothetical protein [Bacteriovoracaceae bacterium]
KVKVHKRSLDESRENTPYDVSVMNALKSSKYPDSEYIMALTIDAPFRSAMYIDKAINTLVIYEVNSVFAVVPENDLFYQHQGNGLVPVGINEHYSPLRFEREYLYRQVGGLLLAKANSYGDSKSIFDGKVGHIVMTSSAAKKVSDTESLGIANYLINAEGKN